MLLIAAQYNAGIVDMQQQNQYNSAKLKHEDACCWRKILMLGTGDVS